MILMVIAVVAGLGPAVERARVFQVEGRTFSGTNAASCVIRGEWSDGEPFHYRAWDSCENMVFQGRIAPKSTDEVVEQIHGVDRTFVIPAGSESFLIGNEFSIVRIFRDTNGEVQEILVSD